jgi:hypothetical protein
MLFSVGFYQQEIKIAFCAAYFQMLHWALFNVMVVP